MRSERKLGPGNNHGRNRFDYVVIAIIAVVLKLAGEKLWPGNTTPGEQAQLWSLFATLGRSKPFGFADGTLSNTIATWASYYLITVLSLCGVTALVWYGIIQKVAPTPLTPSTHFAEQARCIATNFAILAVYQVAWDVLICTGYTKQTLGHFDLVAVLRDSLLWMLVFELTWYTQHRLMHDVKFLWEHGHAYHHGWRRADHMIGITNFAFDHVVETWVTMSSSFAPLLFFPSNFFVAKIVSLVYMLYSLLVHWDWFHRVSSYHLNHHYCVTKNYGSHIPIFDMLFGTYQWDDVQPPGRAEIEHLALEAMRGVIAVSSSPASSTSSLVELSAAETAVVKAARKSAVAAAAAKVKAKPRASSTGSKRSASASTRTGSVKSRR